MAGKKPRISVIMPVYNNAEYLKEAIDSILEQTFTDFELVAVNDGSKDGCDAILEHYAKIDSRVHVVHHKQNAGLVASLNDGIAASKGEFIARMDGDDVSFPRRFEQQMAIFNAQPDVVLVAGGFEVIDEEGEFLYREVVPANDRDIKRSMLLRNPIAHGSVMFRRAAYDAVGPYTNDYGPTEDFELWMRLRTAGAFAGLEATIFRWRVNSKGITKNNNSRQITTMKAHTQKLWETYFPEIIPAKTLRQDGRNYFNAYKKRGFSMREIMFSDNAQIALQMIKRGRLITGLHQLFAVAFCTRTGLKVALHRLRLTFQHGTQGIRRYAKFGRQEV